MPDPRRASSAASPSSSGPTRWRASTRPPTASAWPRTRSIESAGAAVTEVVHAELGRLPSASSARRDPSCARRSSSCCAGRATTGATASSSPPAGSHRPGRGVHPRRGRLPHGARRRRPRLGRAAGHGIGRVARAARGANPELLLRLRERIAEATVIVDAARFRRVGPPARADLHRGRPRQRHPHAARPGGRAPVAVDTPTRIDLTGGSRSTPVVSADATVTFHRGPASPSTARHVAWPGATWSRRSASRWRPRRASCRPTASGRRRITEITWRSRWSAPMRRTAPVAALPPDRAARTSDHGIG